MTTPTPPGLLPEHFFDDAEYARRHAAVRAAMAARGVDVLLCTTPENVCYLTGYQTIAFSSYQLLVFPLDGAPCLVLRFLESMLAARYSVVQDVIAWDDTDDPITVTLNTLRERGLSEARIGYEEQTASNPVTLWARLKSALPTMSDASKVVEVARAVKSDAELACMRKAAAFTDAGVAAAISETRLGATENDVAAAAFAAMTRAGSEPLAKDPIVTSGDRGGVPHTSYMRRKLGTGDTILLEFSGVHTRYYSPLMRSGWLGKLDSRIADWPKICLEALEVGIATCRPGKLAADVDVACRAVIERYDLYHYYRKRAGYSVGTGFASWMENAIANLQGNDRTELKPNMCFHLPIAMRLYGEATIGISETVVITERGAEPLGHAPREFFVR